MCNTHTVAHTPACGLNESRRNIITVANGSHAEHYNDNDNVGKHSYTYLCLYHVVPQPPLVVRYLCQHFERKFQEIGTFENLHEHINDLCQKIPFWKCTIKTMFNPTVWLTWYELFGTPRYDYKQIMRDYLRLCQLLAGCAKDYVTAEPHERWIIHLTFWYRVFIIQSVMGNHMKSFWDILWIQKYLLR